MRIYKRHDFGKVRGYELGWSPVGRPLMTTFCYRVGPVLIDTGLAHMRAAVLAIVNRNPIESILLTHYHEDHSGNAAAIRSKTGIPIYGGLQTAEKLSRPYRIFPYQRLMWGPNTPVEIDLFPGVLDSGDIRLESIHTPGHSRDHTVYLETNHGWLFSGDLYLSHRIKYFRADERIDEQIESLKRVLALDFDVLFCGHRPQPENARHHIRQKLQYLEDFRGSVTELAGRGLDENEIMKTLHLKEQLLIKWMCFGNVSMKNMVRSAMAGGNTMEKKI